MTNLWLNDKRNIYEKLAGYMKFDTVPVLHNIAGNETIRWYIGWIFEKKNVCINENPSMNQTFCVFKSYWVKINETIPLVYIVWYSIPDNI